jgi:hypothetical protein
VDALDEVFEHHFSGFKVGNYAISQRTNGGDCTWRTPHHLLGLFANGKGQFCVLINGNDGRLSNDHASAQDINQDIGGAQINANVSRRAAKIKKGGEFHQSVPRGVLGDFFEAIVLDFSTFCTTRLATHGGVRAGSILYRSAFMTAALALTLG